MNLKEIIETAPKTITKEYLQMLHIALVQQDCKSNIDFEAILSSLLLLIIDPETSASKRHLSMVILQKMSPYKSILEILSLQADVHISHAFPVLLLQDISDPLTKDLIKKLAWHLSMDNWPEEYQWNLLGFISSVIVPSRISAIQDYMNKICSLMAEWLIMTVPVPSSRSLGFRKSSSAISVASQSDGTGLQDLFTVLTPVSSISPGLLRNVQVFSILRSTLQNSGESEGKASREKHSTVGNFACENLNIAIREYCMRVIDQVDQNQRLLPDPISQFQEACLVEVIHLFNILCLMDSSSVHSVFPTIRRIYDSTYSKISKETKAQDVAVICSAMQFFINHGNCVMHKPDNYYTFFFCDLLNMNFKDNYICYEILQLMKENLPHLCYHSSVLEKYFPSFFKVLAWRPNTFLEDFLELLPSFLSQQTSVEVFYTLIDLPCLTAVLIITDGITNNELWLKDSFWVDALKKPEITSAIQFLLRKTSGVNNDCPSVSLLHQTLSKLVGLSRIVYCAEAVIPLLKRYFEVVLQYADATVTSLLVPAILERLSVILPVNKFAEEVCSILSDAIVKLFALHPETVFHCQKLIIRYISHFKNYSIGKTNFIHMVWIVGEYVSVAYSNICRPEIIALFFENLESTTYEALSSLQESSDENFLKLLSVSLTTLSKLASRNQDQVPRAILCLSKVQQQLLLYGNGYKKNWQIVIERVSELLSILKSPNVAAIVLSPPEQLENGRLHRDSTSLPYVLRALSKIVTDES